MIEEASGVIAALVVFPFWYTIAIRFPLVRGGWRRFLPIHFAALIAGSLIMTTLMALQRPPIFWLLGLGKYHYGYMPVRYVMEFANHVIFYWMGMAAIYLFHSIRFARQRELTEAHLQARLAEAQLHNLRLQLEPHFLFNALNAISASVYESPAVADEMIGRLSELLRHLLKNDRAQEVALERELEILNLYTRIMQARWEDRLHIAIEVDPAVRAALVPQLLLQPLVENAIRYGLSPETQTVEVHITAARSNGDLCLAIRDWGPGFTGVGQTNSGIGLRNTADRLSHLYGKHHQFRFGNAGSGGALIEVSIPFRTA